MQLMTLDEIRTRLRSENLTTVATETGLNYNTVRFIRHGRLDNPTLKTMTALTDYFKAKDKEGGNAV